MRSSQSALFALSLALHSLPVWCRPTERRALRETYPCLRCCAGGSSATLVLSAMATPATTGRDIRAVMTMHKSNFPLAFAAVSRYVTGNLNTRRYYIGIYVKLHYVIVLCGAERVKTISHESLQCLCFERRSSSRSRAEDDRNCVGTFGYGAVRRPAGAVPPTGCARGG